MSKKQLPWSWPVFIDGFWRGFGPGMALFVALYLCLILIADTTFATFETAMWGLTFAVIVSVVWGWDKGEDPVRDWRERLETETKTPN